MVCSIRGAEAGQRVRLWALGAQCSESTAEGRHNQSMSHFPLFLAAEDSLVLGLKWMTLILPGLCLWLLAFCWLGLLQWKHGSPELVFTGGSSPLYHLLPRYQHRGMASHAPLQHLYHAAL